MNEVYWFDCYIIQIDYGLFCLSWDDCFLSIIYPSRWVCCNFIAFQLWLYLMYFSGIIILLYGFLHILSICGKILNYVAIFNLDFLFFC